MGANNNKWNGSNWIRRSTRLAIYARDEFTCQYCGQKHLSADSLELDHIVPRARGAWDNRSTNLITCCKRCNKRKAALSLKEFLASLGKRGQKLALVIREQLAKEIDRKLGRELAAVEKQTRSANKRAREAAIEAVLGF